MRAAIYTRVSTDNGTQTVENQQQQLVEFCVRMNWQVVAEFQDHKSGKSLERPGFRKMMESASKREWDVLVFWDLSRLSRGGVSETLRVLEQVKAWGIAYRSLQESYIDTLGPFGDVVISLLASIAKLEREKIRERTLAGLVRARKVGRIGGRPGTEHNLKLMAALHKLRAEGKSIRFIASELGVSPTTVNKLVKIGTK
jgi:DNA invertase Pin-like site-specific DNA recombinase